MTILDHLKPFKTVSNRNNRGQNVEAIWIEICIENPYNNRRVTKFFHVREYGFIYGENGNTYFVHASKLYGEYLDKGYYVYFKTYKTEKSNYNAKDINVIEVPEKRKFK